MTLQCLQNSKQKQRKKDLFFKEYRNKWSTIFGRMTIRQEDKLWEMWIRPTSKMNKF